MAEVPEWQWDERVQVGTDYQDPAEVAAYDARMGRFRDVQAENRAILEALALTPEQILLEFGTGTGSFAIAAAGVCAAVYACDVSPMMLAYAREKAQRAGASNITFLLGGFLTYTHPGPAVDAVVTQLALHHLPDFWKGVALGRIAGLLKPGGKLYLRDVVFSFPAADHASRFDAVLADYTEPMRTNFVRHLAREHSTSDWIMEGLLTRAGFCLESCDYQGGVFARYLCRKRKRGECEGA